MIYTLGETVLDIIFSNAIPVSATPGGSMLNTAVSLGRMKAPVAFISEYANDHTGTMIHHFLVGNGVDVSHISNHQDGKTSLALAFLDEQNNASYSFYKNFPRERLNIVPPEFKHGDFLLFGSFFSLDPGIRPRLLEILHQAKEKGVTLIYDPNFRKPHLKDLPKVIGFIHENIALADIVKASDEDFQNIFTVGNPKDAYAIIHGYGCKTLFYTMNSRGVVFISETLQFHTPVPQIKPLSTIGAGDSFSAGMLFALWKNSDKFDSLKQTDHHRWKMVVESGIAFAAEVCMSYENYISNDFASKYND